MKWLLQESERPSLMAGLQSLHGWMTAQSKINPRPPAKRTVRLDHQEKEVRRMEETPVTSLMVRRKMST